MRISPVFELWEEVEGALRAAGSQRTSSNTEGSEIGSFPSHPYLRAKLIQIFNNPLFRDSFQDHRSPSPRRMHWYHWIERMIALISMIWIILQLNSGSGQKREAANHSFISGAFRYMKNQLLLAQSDAVLWHRLRRADWRFALVCITFYVGHSSIWKKYIILSRISLKLDSWFIWSKLLDNFAY